LPLEAFSPFTFDSETLAWRRCRVVEFSDPLYRIEWVDEDVKSTSAKDVGRISLRFDFDNPERFELRRRYAFCEREAVVALLQWRLYLAAQDGSEFTRLDPAVLGRIVQRVCLDSKLLPPLIQEAIEEYYLGLKLGK
jgi:hypothetical protein